MKGNGDESRGVRTVWNAAECEDVPIRSRVAWCRDGYRALPQRLAWLDGHRIEPNHLLGIARPSALAAWRASGEAGSALQRVEQLCDFGGVEIDPRMPDEVKQAVIAIKAK